VFRRLVVFLLRPLWELVVRRLPVPDPWERLDTQPRLPMYGSGARLDFARYLEGESLVSVASLEDVQDWLIGCQYERDEVLFGEADFWQHPSTFERLRAGDCEDHAVWAWRKLIELGYDVDLVAGWCVKEGELAGRHARLLLRRDGVEYLFEPVAHDRAGMLRPLNEVRDAYVPQFGVDRAAKRFAFSGYILGERKRLTRQPSAKRIA
jgi:hypothetical protein